MKISDVVQNWPKVIALTLLTAFLFWGYACPSSVESLLTEGKKVTRPELQIEMDTITATARFRLSQLDQQDAFRNVIFDNAFAMVESGGVNPAGIITLLAGLYGLTRAGQDLKNRVSKKKNNNA